MPKKLTTEEFIKKANTVHSDKYIPDIAFPGYQECYNITKEDIHEFNTRTKDNS